MSTSAQVHRMAGSSSRKRPHSEITRSASRSHTPEVPSKRRRRSSPASSVSLVRHMPQSPTPPSSTGRYVGDGFDYRRPVMSATEVNEHDIVDLTADDNDTPPTRHRRRDTSASSGLSTPHARRRNVRSQQQAHLVIDLSDEESQGDTPIPHGHEAEEPQMEAPSSPEVQFVRQRTVRPPSRNNHAQQPQARLQLPPTIAPHTMPLLPDFIRRTTQFMFRQMNPPANEVDLLVDGVMDQIDGLPGHARPPQLVNNDSLEIVDYDNVAFDYGQAGFNIGNPRSSTPPQVVADPYKGPGAAREGFTRNWEEESLLVCAYCGDELAAGETDVKQQVWVNKVCGHVYCGECATERITAKGGNKRDGRRSSKKPPGFTTCKVEGCGKKVNGKKSMLQIYL